MTSYRNYCISAKILLFFFFLSCSEDKTINENIIETYPVTTCLVTDTVLEQEYVAEIQAVQNVEIRARVNGFLDKIYIDEGDYVKEGQLLFSLSKMFYQEDVAKAKAALNSIVAEAETTELELKKVQLLVEKNIVSKTEQDLAQAKLDAMNAKVEEAKANLSSAQLRLSYTNIYAPFDGYINRIPNKKGSLIDEGKLLTTISNNSEFFAYFNVSEKEYIELEQKYDTKALKTATLYLANNQLYPYKGMVETAGSVIDKNTGNIVFRARFPNPNGLIKHGASGKIRIAKKLEKAILVPQKSTFEVQENIYLYIVDSTNRVTLKRINPSFRLQQFYVLESGLDKDERFVYEGFQEIVEGQVINPKFIAPQTLYQTIAK